MYPEPKATHPFLVGGMAMKSQFDTPNVRPFQLFSSASGGGGGGAGKKPIIRPSPQPTATILDTSQQTHSDTSCGVRVFHVLHK